MTQSQLDRGLVGELVRQGETEWAEAEEIVRRITCAIAARLNVAKPVSIDGVGQLRSKVKRRRMKDPEHLGMAIEERVVELRFPAVLHQGEPYKL